MEQHRSAKHVRNSNLPKNHYSPQKKLQSSGDHRIIFKIQKKKIRDKPSKRSSMIGDRIGTLIGEH